MANSDGESVMTPEDMAFPQAEVGRRDDEDQNLLILDGDVVFCQRLGQAFEQLGFVTTIANTVAEALVCVGSAAPAFALLALRLDDGSGLDVMRALQQRRPEARIVILTAYGSTATAVAAIRGGAADYLVKPAEVADIVGALLGARCPRALAANDPYKSAERVRWEHIQHVYQLNRRNLSATARALGMHRRTLQRVLGRGRPA